MKASAAILTVLAFASFVECGLTQESTEAKAGELTQLLVKQHEAWSTKLSTPGASIQSKESSRQGAVVQYRLYVTGLPSDKLYTALNWPVNQPKPMETLRGLSLGKDGLVSCLGRTPEECSDPDFAGDHGAVDFTFMPAKGEPFRVALVSEDSEDFRAATIIVPDPISAKDKGCTLDVVRLSAGFEVAYFTGSGYPPNSEADFALESYGEKHPVKTTSDNQGSIRFTIMPYVKGHPRGTTKVAGAGMACSPSLKFDWGR